MLRADFRKHRGGVADPRARGEIHRRIDMAIKPMRNHRLLLARRPRRQDAQVAIDLHGIGIDDDAAGCLRQFQSQRRLAAGGRPCDKYSITVQTLRIHGMSLVATLICNPADPALDSTVIDGARRAGICQSILWCSLPRSGARSFCWPTWIPP